MNPQVSALKALQGLARLTNQEMGLAIGYKGKDGWVMIKGRMSPKTDLGFSRLMGLVKAGANPDFFADNTLAPLREGISPDEFRKNALAL